MGENKYIDTYILYMYVHITLTKKWCQSGSIEAYRVAALCALSLFFHAMVIFVDIIPFETALGYKDSLQYGAG